MRPTASRPIVVAVAVIFVCTTANACEPIIPMLMAVGGPAFVLRSLYALLVAVAFKSVLFGILQRTTSFWPAFLMMLGGNVVSTVAGFFAALMFAVPSAWPVFALISFVFCWFPAQRLPALAPRLKIGPAAAAFLMLGGLFGSVVMFGVAYAWLEHFHYAGYWVFKVLAMILAVGVSILLSAMWEEWTVWKMSRREKETGFFVPVLRANLYTMLLVMLYGAILILPQRMKSNDFLVKNAKPRRLAVHSRV